MTTKDAEQRAKARRIAENAGEEEESKKREKLQWMYTQKENDEEDYLLGKAVKDDLDFCRQEEKRVEDSFGSLYAQRDSASALQVSPRMILCQILYYHPHTPPNMTFFGQTRAFVIQAHITVNVLIQLALQSSVSI